ncbi:hypothetical protein GCM10012275_19120 [Longimycelium tulufanense]|uniref:Uncharacterized protein n=1 Tax=Longimycelium tulufanense TaxID=907463 RepID=A0A8J3CCE1_9PSEU|nr:hypothetical protein [Longimycelium tulufanense]GGM48264.1 hypothetical protein GCM10012275_19120 [Longimycelium tulufanense]
MLFEIGECRLQDHNVVADHPQSLIAEVTEKPANEPGGVVVVNDQPPVGRFLFWCSADPAVVAVTGVEVPDFGVGEVVSPLALVVAVAGTAVGPSAAGSAGVPNELREWLVF